MEENYKIIEEPLNKTDFVVQFDPVIPKPDAAKPLKSEEVSETDTYESFKTDGFDTPIVVLNQQVLTDKHIKSLTVYYEDFVPTLELVINDQRKEIQSIGGPGLHNHITVILVPPSNGTYRSIALPFYIKERINLDTDTVKYICDFHHVGLSDTQCMQIGDKPLTTYEFCYEMAKRLLIGFACTDKCKDISDARWRQMYSQQVGKFIKEQVDLGGLDENSFFDCWIDTHGYLNLINLSWVLDQIELKAENLSIVAQPKMEIPDKSVEEPEPFEVQRTLSNFDSYPIANLQVVKHYSYLNTKTTQELGTDTSFWCLESAGDQNIIKMNDVKMEDKSLEGKAEPTQYKFRKVEFLGCEMAEDLPYMMQQQTRKHWFEKRQSKKLTVQLMRPNYGLERGTLVNLSIFETDAAKMRQISQNFDNVHEENKVEGEAHVTDDTKPPMPLTDATDGNYSLLNPALSGMYYIAGMLYDYDTEDQGKVVQYLRLIKKSDDNNLFHAKSNPVVTSDQEKTIDTHPATDE